MEEDRGTVPGRPSDAGLRGEVQSLLAPQADSFLESAPFSAIKTLSAGAMLGNFEIVELIGPRRHGRSLPRARFASEARCGYQGATRRIRAVDPSGTARD